MRRTLVIIAVGAIVLSACSDKADQSKGSVSKNHAETGNAAEHEIGTEKELKSLLESMKPGEVKKNVSLVGVLDVGAYSSIKRDPSKLTIGQISILVWLDHSDKKEYERKAEKYDHKTVRLKASVSNPSEKDGQFPGHKIVDVQQIELVP